MTSKQKKVLYRIIIATVLIVAVSLFCKFVEPDTWIEVVLYLIPYFVIGYDILKKAGKGILNKQVFDENFLMAGGKGGGGVLGATVSRASPLCCSTRSASCSRAVQLVRAVRILLH